MMKTIPTFEDEVGNRIVFVPDSNREITHRVEVNNVMVGFLARKHKPTQIVAEFYRNKYRQMGGAS